MPTISRPASNEYAPYYDRYISAVPDGDLLTLMERQVRETAALLRALPESRGSHRYAPDKWSIKDVVAHVVDAERVFAFRALHFARGAPTPLPSFEENEWARTADAEARTLSDLVSELEVVRTATIPLFRGMSEAAIGRRGVANGVEITPRALAWVIAGHERHHVRILRERYLTNGSVGA